MWLFYNKNTFTVVYCIRSVLQHHFLNIKLRKKYKMKKTITTIILLLYSNPALAEIKDSSGKFSLGAFIDTYYSCDFNNPFDMNRVYTTQPLRHNEFNINLATIDLKFNDEDIRSRLALHTGTYVDSNYAAEPQLLKNIFEASAGFKVRDNIWIDAGIFPAHIGFESAISKDNWSYSRSLIAEYSPYYEAGVKLSAAFNDNFSGQFLLLNGWQNIKETNNSKAVGIQLQFKPLENLTLTYNNFFGNEMPDNAPELRFFNNFIVQYSPFENLDTALAFDIGVQNRKNADVWHGTSLQAKYKLIPDLLSFTVRGEYYNDKNQVIVSTKTANGFQVYGASANIDYNIFQNLVWRTEGRILNSFDPIYTTSDKNKFTTLDSFLVTSLAFSF